MLYTFILKQHIIKFGIIVCHPDGDGITIEKAFQVGPIGKAVKCK